jgi:hypothetical protein
VKYMCRKLLALPALPVRPQVRLELLALLAQ